MPECETEMGKATRRPAPRFQLSLANAGGDGRWMGGRGGVKEGWTDGGPAKVDYADSGPHRLYIPRKTVGR